MSGVYNNIWEVLNAVINNEKRFIIIFYLYGVVVQYAPYLIIDIVSLKAVYKWPR